jgi:hypothetical protein
MPGVCTTTEARVSFGRSEKISEQREFYPRDNPAENTKWRTLDLPHDRSVEGVLNPSAANDCKQGRRYSSWFLLAMAQNGNYYSTDKINKSTNLIKALQK